MKQFLVFIGKIIIALFASALILDFGYTYIYSSSIGRNKVENPEAPINLIHQSDCIEIIEKIIGKEIWNTVFNAVAPFHPSRKKYYTEKALQLNAQALQGSAYTSLGVLYAKVPGWPIGFGSDKKAAQLLQKALEINPQGIDPNYFYAEFLADNRDYAAAMRYLEQAAKAPARPGRESADLGRQQEIATLLAKVSKKLAKK